jgi:uncharacterized protein
MAFQIIIDGYNLIRNFAPLARAEKIDFSRGRETLLDWLSSYRQKTNQPILVVFDGAGKGGLREERDFHKGIKVLYSKTGQTADEIIKRTVAKEREKALVVTSDFELGTYCRTQKAGWIRSQDFAQRVQTRMINLEKGFPEDDDSEPHGQKKKGAALRLSKRDRQDRRYWEKI